MFVLPPFADWSYGWFCGLLSEGVFLVFEVGLVDGVFAVGALFSSVGWPYCGFGLGFVALSVEFFLVISLLSAARRCRGCSGWSRFCFGRAVRGFLRVFGGGFGFNSVDGVFLVLL